MAEEIKPQIKKTWKPEIAGILDIIGGLIWGIMIYNITIHYASDAVIFFVLALLALAGGIFSMGRTIWGLAMIGPIALFLCLGYMIINLTGYGIMLFLGWEAYETHSFYLTMTILTAILFGLSISALILTLACKKEFK